MKLKNPVLLRLAAFVLLLILSGLVFIVSVYGENSLPTVAANNIIVLIDPGHGGQDPGKAGRLKDESVINLSVSLKLSELLKNKGFYVVLTRSDENGLYAQGSTAWDKDEDMTIRKNMIKSSNASIAISIHQNSYPDSTCRGAQIFYSDNLEANAKLADILQKQLKPVSPFDNKRQPQINNSLKMIRDNDIPSAIVECGFLSNKEEEYLLNTDEYQQKLAQAVYESICIFYDIEP